MSQEFQNLPVKATSSDGRNFTLCEPVIYCAKNNETFRAAVGGSTDGLSTPKQIWSLIPPFGSYWPAGIIHDAGYRNSLEKRQPDGTWSKIALAKDECDEIFLEAMESLGVELLLREAIYEGVHLGGAWAFDDDHHPKLKAYVQSLPLSLRNSLGVVAEK